MMPHLLVEAQRWECARDLELQRSGGGERVSGSLRKEWFISVDTVTWAL